MQKTLYRFFSWNLFFFVNCSDVVSLGYFIHKPSTKARWGTIFVCLKLFVSQKIQVFWIRLTGERTSGVTSGTSGNHLMVTSVTKKCQAFLVG